MTFSSRLRLVLALPFFAGVARAIPPACKDPSITWWNNADGENPCQQYERLRKFCDTGYEVTTFNAVAPGDLCNAQLNECCHNSVAFTLSMLCLNCQQGTGGDLPGINAALGSYQIYLDGKGDGTNEALPTRVQDAVCESGLRLNNIHYTTFWADGSWDYDSVRKEAEDYPAESNKCEGSATRTPLSVPSGSSQSTQPTETPTHGATTKIPMQGGGAVITSNEIKQDSETDTRPANITLLLGVSLGGFIIVVLLVALIMHLLKLRRREMNPLPVLSVSRSSTPDSTAHMLESQTASREWTILSEPTGGDQSSSRRAPDSTARVPLYHQTSSYAPSSAYNTSDSYSTFIPPASSRYSTFVPMRPASSRYSTFVPPTSTRSPSPPLPQNPFTDRHKARAPLICQTLDTISSVSSDRS